MENSYRKFAHSLQGSIKLNFLRKGYLKGILISWNYTASSRNICYQHTSVPNLNFELFL